jgi:hypothetical protein
MTGIVPPGEGSRFGYNVTAWERAYPDYVRQGSPDGMGRVELERDLPQRLHRVHGLQYISRCDRARAGQ